MKISCVLLVVPFPGRIPPGSKSIANRYFQQECIPVGCVPSATVAICLIRGGAVCATGGWLVRRGVCSRGGVPGPRGVSAPRGVGGFCSGGGIPAYIEADPPSVNRMTGVKT